MSTAERVILAVMYAAGGWLVILGVRADEPQQAIGVGVAFFLFGRGYETLFGKGGKA